MEEEGTMEITPTVVASIRGKGTEDVALETFDSKHKTVPIFRYASPPWNRLIQSKESRQRHHYS